jgi:uncharacterized protein involved in type VI secretion and phage assembly
MRNLESVANKSQFKFRISDLPEDEFLVQHFSGKIALSSHYYFDIKCIGVTEFDISKLTGKLAKLIISWTPNRVYIHGILSQCRYLGPSIDGKTFAYQFKLASWLESLKQRQSAQIFLNKSVIDITKKY